MQKENCYKIIHLKNEIKKDKKKFVSLTLIEVISLTRFFLDTEKHVD